MVSWEIVFALQPNQLFFSHLPSKKLFPCDLPAWCDIIFSSIEHLLPLVAIQLKDSSPEIRLSVVSNVERLKSVIGKREMSKCLLPPIGELAEDSKWRIRMAVVQQLPVIASKFIFFLSNWDISQLSNLWWIPNSVSKGFDTATKTDSSRLKMHK